MAERRCPECDAAASADATECSACGCGLPGGAGQLLAAHERRYAYGPRKSGVTAEVTWLLVVIAVGVAIVLLVQLLAHLRHHDSARAPAPAAAPAWADRISTGETWARCRATTQSDVAQAATRRVTDVIKSISFWSFPAGLPLKEVFKRAKAAGFEAVELTLEAEGEITLKSTAAELKAIRKLAESMGLCTPTFATGLYWSEPIILDGGKTNPQGVEVCKQSLACAKALGASTALTIPCTVTPGLPYDLAYEKSVAALKKLAPLAEKAKVKIGVEYVWNKFLLSPLEFRGFLDEIGSEWVSAYFDVGNVLQSGYPDQWIRILGCRTSAVHFKDFKRSIGTIEGFIDLLEGDCPWEAVMKALKAVKYDGAVTAEMMPPYGFFPQRLIEATSKSMDAILSLA
jgi:L-ribulose-5-phosphate 3-epimerase